MQLSDFDYELPEDLIAQEPAASREHSRMLVVQRSSGDLHDDVFVTFPERLRQGDVLVLNNTKVFPARLFGRSETGAKVEIFLLNKLGGSNKTWQALARPARRLKSGKHVTFGDELKGRIEENLPDGRVLIEFEFLGDFGELLDRVGRTPLPPYIKATEDTALRDRERYQTVFAKASGAIAAPTAGLHFTDEVLSRIEANGVKIAEITLHVGYGTFEPVRATDLSRHSVLPEKYEIGELAARLLNSALHENRRIIAVGTTTLRTLEAALSNRREFTAGPGIADLTVTPGYQFKAAGALLTNFHLPQSSLLILASTFGGHELIMNAYRHAVAARYRFYSYGDCMFIE